MLLMFGELSKVLWVFWLVHMILINHVFASEYRVNTMKEQQRIHKKEIGRGSLKKH